MAHWIWNESLRCFVAGLGDRAALIGRTADQYGANCETSKACFESIHPEDRDRYATEFQQSLDNRQAYQIEFRELFADGRYRHFREFGQAFVPGSSGPLFVAGVTEDITEQKANESRVYEIDALLRQAADMAQLGHWIWDEIEDRCIYCSPTLADMFEMTPKTYLETYGTMDTLRMLVHPADRARYDRVMQESAETATGYDIEYRERSREGKYRHFRERGEPLLDSNGRLVRFVGTLQDITHLKDVDSPLGRRGDRLEASIEQRTEQIHESNDRLRAEILERWQAEHALQESLDRLRLITDNLPALIAYVGRDCRIEFINSTGAKWHSRSQSEVVGMSLAETKGGTYEAIKPMVESALSGETVEFETCLTFPDGQARNVRAVYVPHKDENAEVRGFFALVEDITKNKRAEEVLRHAQKMEALGQLTGGAAHDFNNLLEIILSNTELLAQRHEDSKDLVSGIERAGRSAKDLTQRLLAFSRRQPLHPQIFNLGDLVDSTETLLRRTLGPMVTIERRAQAGLWLVRADPGQVENALVNLAINARDAMPSGGQLVIETKNAVAGKESSLDFPDLGEGDFVVLAVRDTGLGMNKEVLARAVEPFFTTKPPGEGTGLGLSMVYGFALQSGGHLSLESQEGDGTTVKLYLPRAADREEQSHPRHDGEIPAGQGELILLVEDDAEVRSLLVRMLEALGYRVLPVGNAAEALEQFARTEAIDILLSDVVLPGELDGTELAKQVQQQDPDIRLLFMTGYSPTAADDAGFDLADYEVLRKPFSKKDLALKLRETLQC